MSEKLFDENEGRALEKGEYIVMVSDSRGTFTLEEWQKMPPEIPPPLKPWWKD